MPQLPEDIDTTYADDAADPSAKEHQQHHDALHGLNNRLQAASTRVAHGATGTTETFDVSAGDLHTVILDANCTVTFVGAPVGVPASMTLVLVQDATGGRKVTWPAGVRWPGRSGPTLTTAANGVDIITFVWDGTYWYGITSGQNLLAFTAPAPPVIGTATAGNGFASVTFTPPLDDGGDPVTSYTVTSSPGAITASGSASPITVTGLTNGTAYTFPVTATNSVGTSSPSAASNSVTPSAELASDNFDRADSATLGTSSSGKVWTANVGAWKIVSNKAARTSGAPAVATVDVATGDVTVKADINLVTEAGLALRYSGTGDYISADLYAGTLYLHKRVGGVNNQLASSASGIPSSGLVELRVVASGSSLSVYVGGVLKIGPITDSFNATATRVGLFSGIFAGDTTSTYDNFLVT